MRLIEEILKKDSIDFKYLFKFLKKELFKILIITFTLFSLSAFFSYQKVHKQIDMNFYFKFEKNIDILNEEYRKAISNNATFKQFMIDFINDFYKYYKINLEKYFLSNSYILTESSFNKDKDYFHFRFHKNLWNSDNHKPLNFIKNEFRTIFEETLTIEAAKYSAASDIDYKTLKKSLKFNKITILEFSKINYILILISAFFTSLIISVLFILFKKHK